MEQYLYAHGGVTWHRLHERWLQDGSVAGRQTEGAGTVSRTSKVAGRLIECLYVWVTSFASPRWQRREENEGRMEELRVSIAAVCSSFSLLLSLSIFLSLPL